MPIEIWLAPVGAGKTAHALEQLAQTLDEQPFARVWVLVSGRRQEDNFRQRLIERADSRSVYFNVEFFSFYQLYHRLLNIAQQPPRMLDHAARFGLLRAILADLKAEGQLQVYAAISETPGFLRSIAAFIYELKQNLVTPERFLQAAQSAKDHEIARIYAAYQNKLRDHDLVDRDGEGWLALYHMQRPRNAHIARDVDLLLVDGYDQFTPLQASLLTLVAGRARRALVTLAAAPGRETTLGRRFVEALGQIQKYSPTPPIIINMPIAPGAQRPPALQHLVDHLLLRDAMPQPADDRVTLIEAPDAGQEAAAVLRRVKRLLLEGAQPDDVLIALRDWPRYAGHLQALGQAYGVPLALHQGEPLTQNPVMTALLNLLALHETDFRRRDLLDVLRSPYLHVPGIGSEQIDQIEAVSQQFAITGGRANWLDALQLAYQPVRVTDDEDALDSGPLLDADAANHLRAHLTQFFRQVTPPQDSSLATYAYWLHDLIGRDHHADPDDELPADQPAYTLNMPEQIRREAAPGVVDRDLTALDTCMRVLRGLLSAETLLESLTAGRQMNRTLFLVELRAALQNTTISRAPARFGRVLVTTVTDARGLPHKHVFIPGLSEGIFPVPQAEDPLYLDSERAALIERGITLETQAERAADDGLFYELIGLARETLTLSRPTVQDGAHWIASHLWRSLRDCLSNAEFIIQANAIKIGAVVPVNEAAAPGELLLALADGLIQPEMADGLPGVYHYVLQAHGDQWRRIDHARGMELRRMNRRLRHDGYTGRPKDPDLIAYVTAQLGPDRVWSATQLHDYGVCGFRFFARRLLRLEALEEPEEGLDAPKLGTINHAILEATYREILRRNLLIVEDNQDEALDILRAEAAPILDDAPRQYSFPANALWAQEKVVLLRRLEAMVRRDFSPESPAGQFSTSGARWAHVLEAPFTVDGGPPVVIPVEVAGRIETLRVQGYIDRIDRVDDGVIIIDYKSGSTKIPVDEMRIGRNFQMMIYLHAAEQILKAQQGDAAPQVVGGLFWHIRSLEASGSLRLDDDGIDDLEQAAAHIGRFITAGRRGNFGVQPRKLDKGKCEHYCEYAQLCRVASTNRYKPEGDDA